jgi:predicted regulator of Ras-like GTPase activity (Roadblock/LC7/MglB family)
MTFREILSTLVDRTPGALAAAVMAGDGVAIDEYAREGAEVDLGAIAVEFGRIFAQSQKVASALYGSRDGELDELLLVLGGHQILFRKLDEDSFLLLALDQSGLVGKARWLARNLLQEIRDAL